MAIITPEELVGQISASRQPLGQLRTIDNIDGGISTSGKIIGTKVGCKGEPGDAATITIGTVSTVSATTPASVVNVGTPTNAIFNFEIPKGADGGGGGGTWGGITGTLSDQTDLKNALDDKIGKSLTAGLVKNDGTIDTTSYSTFSGNYSDLSGKPTIPTVNDKKITIQKNGTNVDYFTTNNSANKTINITVPTDTNDLTNSAGFITASENNTITGELTFSTLPKSSITPTNNDHLTRKGYVDNQTIKQDLSTAGIDDYSSLSTYTVGNYVSYNNLIYKCNTAIAIPEEWDNTHWTQKTYLEYLSDSISSGTVNDSTITIQKGGVTVDSFTTNAANNKTINIPATIIESGSNSNGTYIKYSDGTMICYNSKQVTEQVTSTWGALYVSQQVSLGTFPQAFINIPTLNVYCSGNQSIMIVAAGAATTTDAGKIQLARADSATVTTNIGYIAIGRWKA